MRRLTPSGSRPTSMPPTVAVPEVGFNSPHNMRMVVDLPAPLLPRKPKISPARTSNDTLLTATKAPKRLERSRTSMALAAFIGPLPPEGPIETRFRQSYRRERARAIELTLEQRQLGGEHVALRDDAGAIALADHSPRFGGRAPGF